MVAQTDKPGVQSRTVKRMAIFFGAVAVLVFGVTFVTQFLGNKGSDSPPPPVAKEQLAFPINQAIWDPPFPGMAGYAQEYEWPQSGQYAFWFENLQQGPVDVQLNGKNCTCSKVEICIAPADAKNAKENERRARAEDANLKWHTFEKVDSGNKDPKHSFQVPAGAAGWARLSWNSENRQGSQVHPRPLQARLATWTGSTAGKDIDLSATPLYVDAFHVQSADASREKQFDNTASIGILSDRQEGVVTFICWSSTRDKDQIHLTLPSDPLIVWDSPVELTPDRREELARRYQRRVKCGFVLTARVRPNHLGPFHKLIDLTPSDDSRAEAIIKGTVRGDVTLLYQGEEREAISMGRFPVGEGSQRTVQLETLPGMELQVETGAKLPEWLKIEKLGKNTAGGDGAGNTWDLVVKIPPGTKAGPFNDDFDESCVLYLRIVRKDGTTQQIRIPVVGEGTQ